MTDCGCGASVVARLMVPGDVSISSLQCWDLNHPPLLLQISIVNSLGLENTKITTEDEKKRWNKNFPFMKIIFLSFCIRNGPHDEPIIESLFRWFRLLELLCKCFLKAFFLAFFTWWNFIERNERESADDELGDDAIGFLRCGGSNTVKIFFRSKATIRATLTHLTQQFFALPTR